MGIEMGTIAQSPERCSDYGENCTGCDLICKAHSDPKYWDEIEEMKRKNMEQFEEGDIIYDGWGYNQTQYDFAQIVEISKTGKTVLAKMMNAKTVDTTRTSNVLVPTETYGKSFRLWVREGWRGQPAFIGQYPYIYSDQDSKRKGCFTHWEGNPVYETNPQYGH